MSHGTTSSQISTDPIVICVVIFFVAIAVFSAINPKPKPIAKRPNQARQPEIDGNPLAFLFIAWGIGAFLFMVACLAALFSIADQILN